MAGGHGFVSYPQRGTPRSQAVGDALMQQGQQQEAAPLPGQPVQGLDPQPPDPMATRMEGARRMGGPGQMDHDEQPDGHSVNAINVAVGEALTRMGGGYTTNPDPNKDRRRNIQHVQQLGMSETEAQLMAKTGGI